MEPFVNAGPRTGTLHASWHGREIQNNEPVLIEIGGCVNRYHAALMRTVFLGAVPKELRHWANIAIEALNAAIDAIRPGVTAGQVDQACRGVIEKAGLYDKFRKRTGYSIGLAYAPDWGEGHFMSLQKDDPTVLKPGMTFHMPPALREYGKYGFGASEMVLVTESGCEVLTTLPERLVCK
jgi:Xaa-Pro dipeptidase